MIEDSLQQLICTQHMLDTDFLSACLTTFTIQIAGTNGTSSGMLNINKTSSGLTTTTGFPGETKPFQYSNENFHFMEKIFLFQKKI